MEHSFVFNSLKPQIGKMKQNKNTHRDSIWYYLGREGGQLYFAFALV